MHHSEIGVFINDHLVHPLAGLLGFHIEEGHHLIPDHILMILLVALIMIVFSIWLRGRLSVENPSKAQHIVEVIIEAVQGLMRDVIGKRPNTFLPLIGTLGIYILVGNLLGLVPGFASPTANINIPGSCAICVFFYYNYHGIRKNGFLKYMKHFAGPVIWMAWLLFPIEVVSHMARPMSLSLRLFGNIYAKENILYALNHDVFPFGTSIPVIFLGIFASTVQAFIFILLTMVYLSGAVEEGHDEDHGAVLSVDSAHSQPNEAAA